MSLERDISLATELINKKNIENIDFYIHHFYHLYSFTTENLKEYFSKFDLKNKDVLTTGSSGDQILNAISMGCKSVTCFDINPFVKYYYELKKVAIENLKYNDFINFFCSKHSNFKRMKEYTPNLDYETYSKLSILLSHDTKIFWDSLFSKFEPSKIRDNLFFEEESHSKILSKVNIYLKIDDYYELRSKLKNVEVDFIECDIRELSNKLIKKYDYMFFSNIMQNMSYLYEKEQLKNLKELLINLDKFLKDNGEIEVCYLYKLNKFKKYGNSHSDIYKLQKVNEEFKNQNLYLIKIKGICALEHVSPTKDYVLMYKKKK